METNYRESHLPSNEDCPHNADPSQSCTCKRTRERKPFRTVRVLDETAGQGVRPRFVVEVHPQGLLVIREQGRTRKSSIEVTIASVYERALMVRARNAILAKRQARQTARKARRAIKKGAGQ